MIFALILIQSCMSKEEKERSIEQNSFDIKVLDLKQVTRGESPSDFYMVDSQRNSYKIRSEDYVRLKEGDSLKIYTLYLYAEILEIYTK